MNIAMALCIEQMSVLAIYICIVNSIKDVQLDELV